MNNANQTTPATSTIVGRLARIVAGNKWLQGIVHSVLVEEDLNDPVIEAMRWSRCKGCPFNSGGICLGCGGCALAVKVPAKTNLNIYTGRIEVTHCPEGKWDDENLMVYYKTN